MTGLDSDGKVSYILTVSDRQSAYSFIRPFQLMGKERIERMFASVRERERPGLVVFLTAGFPDMAATMELVPALVDAGADAVEIGVPFSDPLAEGPVIQQSSFLALQNGVTSRDCLDAVESLRSRVPDTPLILMGYYNPIYSFGVKRYAQECHRVGVDGLIAVDLPGTESGHLAEECGDKGISLIPLLAPTSTDESIAESCKNASGFVYCVSVTGVTGARNQVSNRGYRAGAEGARPHQPALGHRVRHLHTRARGPGRRNRRGRRRWQRPGARPAGFAAGRGSGAGRFLCRRSRRTRALGTAVGWGEAMTVCRGIRGATVADDNTGEAIHGATTELLEALIERNGIEEMDVASVIFTMTPDLNAVFPARGRPPSGLEQHGAAGSRRNGCARQLEPLHSDTYTCKH